MQVVLYRPVVADDASKLIGASGFAADVIPVAYRGFSPDGSFAAVLNDGFDILPLLQIAQERYIAGGTDASPFYPAVVFFKAAFHF